MVERSARYCPVFFLAITGMADEKSSAVRNWIFVVGKTTVFRLLPLVLALSIVTCGDPAAIIGPPGLTIIAGAGVTDTIEAQPTQALIVEVRTPSGAPARGAVVRFASGPIDIFGATSMTVGPIDGEPLRKSEEDTVGADARAAVRVAMGTRAGPGDIQITVAELGLHETASFTIIPGNAVRVVSEPADTAISVSRGFTLRASVRDRYGNARSDAITLASDSAAAAASPTGAVSGVAAGRARVRASDAAGHGDTSWVSVVPHGTIAGRSGPGIVIVDIDGSNYRIVPGSDTAEVTWLDWNAQGDTLVFSSLNFASSPPGSRLFVSDLVAQPEPLLTDSIALFSEYDPQYSGDGQWVYFGGNDDTVSQEIWRARSNGSSLARVGPAHGYGGSDGEPAPSSDGQHVAFVSNRCCYPNRGLFVLNVQTGVIDSLAASARRPRWSPGDSLIGFMIDGGGIWTIRPDGSGLREVTPSGLSYYEGFDWSPTGEWIVVQGPSGNAEVIRAADGLVLPLPYSVGGRPAWRP